MNILFNNGLDSITVLMTAAESTITISKPSKEITVEQEVSNTIDSGDTNSKTMDTGKGETGKEDTDKKNTDKEDTDKEDTDKENTDKQEENKENTDKENADTTGEDKEDIGSETDPADPEEGLENTEDQAGQDVNTDTGEISNSDMGVSGDMGMPGDMGMSGDMGMESTKDPLLASWPTVIGISGATLLLGAVIGILLARKKIKKGFELYED